MSGALELLDHVFGEERGFVAVFSGLRSVAESNNLGATRSAYFRYPDERHPACECMLSEDEQGWETYLCAHLLKARRRVKANAEPLLSCYVDGDGAKSGPSIPAPTATVESSPGREQFYWRLTRPVVPEFGEELNRRLALAMGGDRSGWNLTQLLNAWCELRSPPQQVGEGQPGTTKLIIEPDAEVVQSHPRRQPRPQSTQLLRPLPPQTESVEQLS